MKVLNPVTVLRAFVATHTTQQTAARALGISPAYLSDLLHERRDLSATLLAKLGLRRIVVKADSFPPR